MSDQIPAKIAAAIDKVDQSEEIAAVDAKVDANAVKIEEIAAALPDPGSEHPHESRLSAIEAKIQHLFDGLAHILPPMKD